MSPKELIADIESGFYVTEMMGMGVNGVTGDYSRGAAGFWIEKGEIAFPVSEMTVAGNLKDMFARLVAANDLEFKAGADSPTLRIDDLTVAGALISPAKLSASLRKRRSAASKFGRTTEGSSSCAV